MKGRCSACIDTGMTNGRNCWQIVNQTVVARVTFLNQPLQTIFTKLVIIAPQIIPAHLVYSDSNYELRALVKVSMSQ